jgi:hypothetical protein
MQGFTKIFPYTSKLCADRHLKTAFLRAKITLINIYCFFTSLQFKNVFKFLINNGTGIEVRSESYFIKPRFSLLQIHYLYDTLSSCPPVGENDKT